METLPEIEYFLSDCSEVVLESNHDLMCESSECNGDSCLLIRFEKEGTLPLRICEDCYKKEGIRNEKAEDVLFKQWIENKDW